MKLTQLFGVLATAGLFVALYFIFAYVPVEESMLEVQKIFYFHVSSAFTVFVAFGVTCVCSILYLIKRNEKYDMVAVASAELGSCFLHNRIGDGTNLGAVCMEYMVGVGTQINEHTYPLADVHRLLCFESCCWG